MAALAAFAASDAGQFHALVSQRYGVDPASGIGDGVIAANLRAALFVTSKREGDAEPQTDPGFIPADYGRTEA